MICTETLGGALKIGNLNSPRNVRLEVDGLSCTDAPYMNAANVTGFGSKYTVLVI
jgi:hypothetical protein